LPLPQSVEVDKIQPPSDEHFLPGLQYPPPAHSTAPAGIHLPVEVSTLPVPQWLLVFLFVLGEGLGDEPQGAL
jgi:hypothetical protein